MKKIIFIFFITTSLWGEKQDFVSLQRRLAQWQERVASDNHDWKNPSYNSYYKKIQPTWTDTILRLLHLKKDDPWSIQHMSETFQAIVEDQKRFLEKGAYAVHITAKPDTKFVIWGDLYGAVHSLFRDLEYFREQGIIDDQFRIIKPNYYFVFLGNVVTRSPYSLATLHIVVLLMERNPGKAFFIKGTQESNNFWKDFNFKKEVTDFFSEIPNKSNISYENLIGSLFDSLPGALYITQKDGSHNVIALSNQPHSYDLHDININQFFSKDIDNIDYVVITPQSKSTQQQIETVAIVKGGSANIRTTTSQGLTLLEPDQGATTWSVLSCPTQIYQDLFGFYYDAFAILTIGPTIKQATIQLLSQDVRNKQGFQAGNLFNIATGQIVVAATATEKSTYLIGTTIALTKSLGDAGRHIQRGITTLINQSNQSNYLGGHFVKSIILDDQYMPALARKNIETLINEYKIDTTLLSMGSPTLLSYLDLVKSGKITVLFPETGSPDFRKPDLKNIIHFRASYQEEAHALMEYMLTTGAAKRFAFFYQNDAYGLGPLATAHEMLKAKGITDWVDVPYNKVAPNFAEAADLIKKAQPDAIGFFSVANITEELFRVLGIETLFNKKLFGISFLAESTLRKFLKDHGIFMLFSAVVPNPKTSNLEIVKEFRALMDANNYEYDIYSLEGYIGTSLYLESLKSIKDNVTSQKIIEYFESYKDFQFKGLTFTFEPMHRSLSQSVWLELNDGQWKEIKASTVTSDIASTSEQQSPKM